MTQRSGHRRRGCCPDVSLECCSTESDWAPAGRRHSLVHTCRSMQAYEGVLPNVDFAACSRTQLQEAYPSRFFPCSEADNYDFSCSQQLRQHLQPEQIACLQQGSTAWHQARSRHITGSRIGDLLGFNSPKPNRLLVEYGVYHAVSDRKQAQHQLRAAVAALRGGEAAGAAAHLGAFGTLCCAWGCKHEAVALHTLLHYAPPGSWLLDSGFVTLSHDTVAQNPDLYQEIFNPPQGSAEGTPGVLVPQQVIEALRLGCSLDGLLAVPADSTAAPVAGSAVLCADDDNIRRAPPYTWITEAGYKACVVEVKCPAPYYPVSGQPWAFGMRGALACQPYKCLKAHYYCQAQLNMLITGTDTCVFVVWTRTCTWLLHIPINKSWLHICLHLLMTLHNRYVAPHQQQHPSPADTTPVSQAVYNSPESHVNGGSGRSLGPVPPENMFWYDEDPTIRQLYRSFIIQTAQLAASMRSDALPDPLGLPAWGNPGRTAGGHTAAAAAARQIRMDAPPSGWNSGINSYQGAASPAAAAAAAATAHQAAAMFQPTASAVCTSAQPVREEANNRFRASRHHTGASVSKCANSIAQQSGQQLAVAGSSVFWVADVSLGTHSCLVKSVNLPWSKQRTLQRDRWFLDRCDPDDPSLPHIHQAWLEHPLLEHTVQHPQAMMALLQLLQESQRPVAAVAGCTPGHVGGLSPGPGVMAMILKMEQIFGLQLHRLWQQLPPGAQQYIADLKAAMGRLAASSSVVSTRTVDSSLWYGGEGANMRPNSVAGPSLLHNTPLMQSWGWGNLMSAQQSMEHDAATAGMYAHSRHATLDARSSGGWDSGASCDSGGNGTTAASADGGVSGLDALWQSRRRGWGAAATALRQQRRNVFTSANGADHWDSSIKHAIAKRVVGSARHRQQMLTRAKYRLAVKLWPVSEMVAQYGPPVNNIDRVWLDQPLHVVLQQAIAHSATPSPPAAAAAKSTAAVANSVMARLLSRKRRLQEQKLDQSIAQQHTGGCDECCSPTARTQSAPAVLQIGQFVGGGVRVSNRTGRKVFRRKFLRAGGEPNTAAAAAAATIAKAQRVEASADQPAPPTATVVSAGEAAIEADAVGCAHTGATGARIVVAAGLRMTAGFSGLASCSRDTERASGTVVAIGSGAKASVGVVSPQVSPATSAVATAARAVSSGSKVRSAAAGPFQRCHRRSKSCPCFMTRRRSPALVQRPPAHTSVAGGSRQQQQSKEQLNVLRATSGSGGVCHTIASTRQLGTRATQPLGAPAGLPSLAIGTSPAKRTLLGWCNLGAVPESSGPRFSPGAAAASGRVKPRTVSGSFKALLRSRSIKASNRTTQAVECAPLQQQLLLAEAATASTTTGSSNGGDAGMQLQLSESCHHGTVKLQQEQCVRGDSNTRYGSITDTSIAKSSDHELDDLLASGALDEILGRSIQDWKKLVLQ